MWPFHQKLSVGIDLGTESVKVVCLSALRGEYELVSFGQISQKNTDDLRAFLQNPQLDGASLRVSMRDNLYKSKKLELPPGPEEELNQMLGLSLGPSLGGPVEDYVLRYQPLQKIVLISEKAQLDSFKQELQGMGIGDIDVLEPRVNALAMSAVYNHPFNNAIQRQAVVDIGHGSALFLVASPEGLLFSRNLSDASGRDLLNQVALSCGVPFEEAMRLRDADSDFLTLKNPNAKTPIIQWLYKVAVEIQNSVESYQLQFPKDKVTDLLITGGASKTSGIIGYVSDTLKIPVSPLRAFRQINTSGFSGADFEQIEHSYGVAVGLAL